MNSIIEILAQNTDGVKWLPFGVEFVEDKYWQSLVGMLVLIGKNATGAKKGENAKGENTVKGGQCEPTQRQNRPFARKCYI